MSTKNPFRNLEVLEESMGWNFMVLAMENPRLRFKLPHHTVHFRLVYACYFTGKNIGKLEIAGHICRKIEEFITYVPFEMSSF